MIELLEDTKEINKALSKLAGFFYENGKIGGELAETFLVQTFNKLNVKSKKVEGRKKADIEIDDISYSVKSASTQEIQLNTLSDGKITVNDIVELGECNLVTDKKYKKKLKNKTKILNKICKSLDNMPIILFNFTKNANKKATFKIMELSHEDLISLIKEIDDVYYERPSNKNKITFVKDGKVRFTLKDGTGNSAANAFQRGLWTTDVSFITNYKYFENITIKEVSFYDN